jgi:hypothetical protein
VLVRASLLGCVLATAACGRATVVVVDEPQTPAPPPSIELEQEAVREAVRSYAGALSARDPAAATATVVSETFVLYDDLRLLALSASPEQLERSDLMTIMLVLQIRARFRRGQLETVDGRALFEHAVEAGLVGERVDEVPLDEVWIAEDGMHAQIRTLGDPVVWLRKQDDRWRIDIPEMIRGLGPALDALAHERVLVDGKLHTAWGFIDSTNFEVLEGPIE